MISKKLNWAALVLVIGSVSIITNGAFAKTKTGRYPASTDPVCQGTAKATAIDIAAHQAVQVPPPPGSPVCVNLDKYNKQFNNTQQTENNCSSDWAADSSTKVTFDKGVFEILVGGVQYRLTCSRNRDVPEDGLCSCNVAAAAPRENI